MRFRSFIAILILLAVVVFQQAGSLYMVYFKLNQEYITVKYCINKDAPEKKCNGKCHMRKQLKQLKEYKTVDLPLETSDFKPISHDWVPQSIDAMSISQPFARVHDLMQMVDFFTPSKGFYLISVPPPEC